jgi:glyceraldehyde 3-phosphate dehydrogenase
MPRVAINGLGRIGRAALRILLDDDTLDLVAVNDVADADNLAYLIAYDTVYGRYHRTVHAEDGALIIDGTRIPTFAERDPEELPWADLGVDLVLECTGKFTHAEDLTKHVRAGASFVILSAPSHEDTVPTVVHGANRAEGNPQIIFVRELYDELHHPGHRDRQSPVRCRTLADDHHARLHRQPADG